MNWGVLYYAFAVLLLPVQRELQLPPWAVTAAFSSALLMSAVLAPVMGRWNDRGHALRSIGTGGGAAAVLLLTWSLVPGVLAFYLVWIGLGICMAAALYEPAFVLILRSHGSTESRQRALAIVTIYGGLASTVFLPGTQLLVSWGGWRVAVAVLAGLVAVSTMVTVLLVSRGGVEVPEPAAPALASRGVDNAASLEIQSLAFTFGLSTLASAAFIANLVPALGERGIAPETAAWAGGLFGLLQLPGRALMVNRRLSPAPGVLVLVSLAAQALGLVVVAAVSPLWAIAIGVMTFALGAGLTALARPSLVYSQFGLHQSGYVNGRLARAQQFARAVGPVAASAAATLTSHATVLVLLALVLAWLAWRFAINRRGRSPATAG